MSKQRIRERHERHLARDDRTETVTVIAKRAPTGIVSGGPVVIPGLADPFILQLMPVPRDGQLATAAPNLAGGVGNYLGIGIYGLPLTEGDELEVQPATDPPRLLYVNGVGSQWPTFTALAVGEHKA